MCIFAAMNENILPIHFAPLQGYTDAVYRRAHARIFGGIETYYSPFVRMEHGEIRRKDARDIEPDNNPDLHLIPQLIAPDADKLEHIMSLSSKKDTGKRTSIWVVLFRCWPGATMAAACCPIPKK